MKILVVDAGDVGGGATAAGMGHVVTMDDSPAQLALTSYSQRLWHELADQLPDDAEFEPCGTLWVAADEEEMEEVRRKQRVYASAGVPSDILSATMLAHEEPHLRPLAGALLVHSDAVLYPPCAAGYLMSEAIRMGARLQVSKRVVSAGSGRVRLDDGTKLHAGTVVNACGAEAGALTPGTSDAQTQGASGDHRSISGIRPPSAGGTGISKERSLDRHRLGSVQCPAAQNRPTPDWLVTRVGAEGTDLNRALLAAMITRARGTCRKLATCQRFACGPAFARPLRISFH